MSLLASTFVEERRGYLLAEPPAPKPFRTPFWLLLVPLAAALVWAAPIWHPYAHHSELIITTAPAHATGRPIVYLEGRFRDESCPEGMPMGLQCLSRKLTAVAELRRNPFGPVVLTKQIGARGGGITSLRLAPGAWWLSVDVPILRCPQQTPFVVPRGSRVGVDIRCRS